MNLASPTWTDLIPVFALIPYAILGRPLYRLWRRHGIPGGMGPVILIKLVVTVIYVIMLLLFDAPRWWSWVWGGFCLVLGFGACAVAFWRNRAEFGLRRYLLFGPRMPILTAEERDLVDRAESQAVAGMWFDPGAGVRDLRARAGRITTDESGSASRCEPPAPRSAGGSDGPEPPTAAPGA